MGELDCEMRQRCVLNGLNGTGFVDDRKKVPVSGFIDIELVYKVR